MSHVWLIYLFKNVLITQIVANTGDPYLEEGYCLNPPDRKCTCSSHFKFFFYLSYCAFKYEEKYLQGFGFKFKYEENGVSMYFLSLFF